MRLLRVFLIILVSSASYAYAGRESGGGDICEPAVMDVRDDIKRWIENGGHESLDLPDHVSHDDYKQKMMKVISITKVACVGPGDRGYPVIVGQKAKTCRFDVDWMSNRVVLTCDLLKVKVASSDELYRLIHHEIAGAAGIESPDIEDVGESDYRISSQISHFRELQAVPRLAIVPIVDQLPSVLTSINGAIFTLESTPPGFGVAYRDPSGLVWMRDLAAGTANTLEVAARICTSLGARLPEIDEVKRLYGYLGVSELSADSLITQEAATKIIGPLPSWTSTRLIGGGFIFETTFGRITPLLSDIGYRLSGTRCVYRSLIEIKSEQFQR